MVELAKLNHNIYSTLCIVICLHGICLLLMIFPLAWPVWLLILCVGYAYISLHCTVRHFYFKKTRTVSSHAVIVKKTALLINERPGSRADHRLTLTAVRGEECRVVQQELRHLFTYVLVAVQTHNCAHQKALQCTSVLLATRFSPYSHVTILS